MNDIFFGIFDWIRNDYKSYKFRFCVEVLAWAISIGCSILMAVTVPDVPFYIVYPLWVTGCSMYAWAAYTRKSFGMLANYLLLALIDTFGLLRMIFL